MFRCKQRKPYAHYASILVQWLQEAGEQGVFSLHSVPQGLQEQDLAAQGSSSGLLRILVPWDVIFLFLKGTQA